MIDILDDVELYWTPGFNPALIINQVANTFTNPHGNLLASGLYRSYITQELANDFPQWNDIRNVPTGPGQQWLASESILLEWVQNELEYNIRSKFLGTSPVEDIDVLFTVSVPSTIDLLNPSPSGVTCVAAPSGLALNGGSQFNVQQVDDLEEFYYNVLPTRIEIISTGTYQLSINGTTWNVIPSGILDKQSKLYDVWREQHYITWCAAGTQILKQDSITMETYETYTWNDVGTVIDLWYDNGYLWCVGQEPSGVTYLSLLSSKTQVPPASGLDYLARYDWGNSLYTGEQIGNIMIDADGYMWALNQTQTLVYQLAPRYDYFILDPESRSMYFRENYSNSGVFVTNTL